MNGLIIDNQAKDAEIDRLQQALVQCVRLASGDHHMIPSDRCDAIEMYVEKTLCPEVQFDE